MTLMRWYGIGCDCGMTAEILPTPAEAWRSAEKAGWTRQLPPRGGGRGENRWSRRDVAHRCPTCSSATSPSATTAPTEQR